MKKLITFIAVIALSLSLACAPATPEAQVEACFKDFIKATETADFELAKSIASKEALETMGTEEQFKEGVEAMKMFEMTLTDVKVDGDSATAKINMAGEVKGNKINQDFEAQFVKEDGKWKIGKMGF